MIPLRLCALAVAFSSAASLVSAAPPPHTWDGADSSWSSPSNWSVSDVPDGETETATFSSSGDITPTLEAYNDYTLDGITFSADAQAYNVTIARNAALTFSGAGIANDSSLEQLITNRGSLTFNNSATANSTTNALKIQNWAPVDTMAILTFNNSSSVGTATFDNWASSGAAIIEFRNAGSGSASISNISSGTNSYAGIRYYGMSSAGTSIIETFANTSGGFNEVVFHDDATAGNSTLSFDSGGSSTGYLSFQDRSTAGSATIDLVFSSAVVFSNSSNAGGATITADSYNTIVRFQNSATAGSATINSVNSVFFSDAASAGSANIVINPGGFSYLSFTGDSTADEADITLNDAFVTFSNSSTAANATITANGQSGISFEQSATGGSAAIQVSIASTLLVMSSSASVGSIEGAGRVSLRDASLSIGASNLDSTFNGRIQDYDGSYGGDIASGGITKIGTGTVTLNGVNTYTGNTLIEAGTLVVNGSLASSLTSVGSTSTLAGSGSLGALVIGSGGTLAPGNSPGTLTAGDTTFESGGIFQFEIANATGTAGSAYDLLSISGTLLLSAIAENPFILDVVSLDGLVAGNAANFNPTADYSFTFLTTTGGITDFSADKFSLLTSNFSNPFAGTWSVSLTNSGHDLSLSYAGASAIPEPSTYAAVLSAAAFTFALWRRRRTT